VPVPATATSPRRDRYRDQRLVHVLGTLAGTGILLVVLGLIAGLVLVGRHGGGPVQGWDNTVWRWSIQHRGPFVGIDKVIATVGDAALLGPLCVALTLLMLAIWRSPKALAPVLAYLGGEGLVTIIRVVIHRNRPATANYPAPGAVRGVHETSFSFPSGHAVAVTAVFFALLGLLALARRAWWPWLLAFCLAAFVADSRLLLGVHWFSDVAIGMVLGTAWGVVVAVTCAGLSWGNLSPGRSRGGAR
jgi:membrane-associated phospholipid phosphatase